MIMSMAKRRTGASHSALGQVAPFVAVARRQRLADLLQIVAGIEALGDRLDGLAQRLAVAQIGRAREGIDLGAGVVDVILARDLEAGLGQQRGQRIADDGAAGMADMQRPGRIGRDILDIDRAARPDLRGAVVRARRPARRRCAPARSCRPDLQIDEARPGDLHPGHVRQHWRAARPAARRARAAPCPRAWPAPWRRWSRDRHGSPRAAARRRRARCIEAGGQARRRRRAPRSRRRSAGGNGRRHSWRRSDSGQAAMRVEGVAVGHAGDVVRHQPRGLRRTCRAGASLRHSGGSSCGLGEIGSEQLDAPPAWLRPLRPMTRS